MRGRIFILITLITFKEFSFVQILKKLNGSHLLYKQAGQNLLRAAAYENLDSIKKELTKGGDINFCHPQLGSVLFCTVRRKNQLLLNFFLDQGTNPNLQDKTGTTALMLALKRREYKCASILLKNKKIDLSLKDSSDLKALDYFFLVNNF